MAIRSKNAHYKMREIQRRHLEAVGERHGVVTVDGKKAKFVIDDLVARTPNVIALVTRQLPADFPAHVAETVLGGLQDAAHKLTS